MDRLIPKNESMKFVIYSKNIPPVAAPTPSLKFSDAAISFDLYKNKRVKNILKVNPNA